MRSRYIRKSDLEKIRGRLGSRWAVYQLMRETGLRVGDAVKVRGTDVEATPEGYYLHGVAEKTGKPFSLPLSSALGARLSRSGKRYCFAGRDGAHHITRQTVWKWMKDAARQSGAAIDGTSPHSLRKCYAVDLMHRDGLEAVRLALQHSNDSVTRLYAYSDTVMSADSDEPIRWRDLDLLCEYLLDRLSEPCYNGTKTLEGDVPKE